MPTVKAILFLKGPQVAAAAPDTTVRQAARRMVGEDVGALIVRDGERMLGIVTERDFLRSVLAAGKDPDAVTVGEIMSSPVKTCDPSCEADEAAQIMSDEHIRHLAVVEGGKLAGIISLRDVQVAMKSSRF